MSSLTDSQLEGFLRGAHIFATSIKKILEEQYLEEATDNRLTFPQYNVLKMLKSGTARHVGDVADFLKISYPAASKIVERLHKMGYITRREDPRDRRASCLEVAPSGEELIEKYENHKKQSVAALLSSVPADQVELFGNLLDQLASQLLQSAPCYQQICMQCGAYYQAQGECALEQHVDCVHRSTETVLASFQDKRSS